MSIHSNTTYYVHPGANLVHAAKRDEKFSAPLAPFLVSSRPIPSSFQAPLSAVTFTSSHQLFSNLHFPWWSLQITHSRLISSYPPPLPPKHRDKHKTKLGVYCKERMGRRGECLSPTQHLPPHQTWMRRGNTFVHLFSGQESRKPCLTEINVDVNDVLHLYLLL